MSRIIRPIGLRQATSSRTKQATSSTKTYKENLLDELNRDRFETENLCDATLQVHGKNFNIHKCIVGKVSAFFKKLFKVEMKEKYDSFANIKGLTSETMEIIINYIYTGSVDINQENVLDLLAAAEYLLIDGLRELCGNYLLSNIQSEYCIKYFLVAKTYKLTSLELKAEVIFFENFEEIIQKTEFVSLEKDDLMYLLSRIEQRPSAFKETKFVEGILTWVKHDVEERKKILPEMLKSVVFRFLPKHYLEKMKTEPLVKEIRLVTDLLDMELKKKQARSVGAINLFVVLDKTDVYIFDLFTSWRKLPDLPSDATGACFVVYQKHIYVIGGEQDKRAIHRLRLNGENSAWEDAGRTLQDRNGAGALVEDDTIVITGGSDSSSVESYKITKSQLQQENRSPMNNQRRNHSMVRSGGRMYCYGGAASHSSGAEQCCYIGGKWTVFAEKKWFYSCVAVVANNDIYILGNNYRPFERHGRFEVYYGGINAWRDRERCELNYEAYAACYMEGKIYTFGRVSNKKSDIRKTQLATCEDEPTKRYVLAEYDVALNTWRTISSFPCSSSNSSVSSFSFDDHALN